jgi:hypothetical protein
MSHRRPLIFTCGQYWAVFDFEQKWVGLLFGLLTAGMLANTWGACTKLFHQFSWGGLLLLIVCGLLFLGAASDFAYWVVVQFKLHKSMQNLFENYREISSRFDSRGACGHPIRKGDLIGWNRRRGTRCALCWEIWKQKHAEKRKPVAFKPAPRKGV